MKKTLLIAALALTPTFLLASTEWSVQNSPPEFSLGYQWSLSGKEYATLNYGIRKDVFFKGLDFTAVAGYEVRTGTQPSMGFGFTYEIDLRPAFAQIGVFALFPQSGKPDVGLGLNFGVKF